jgi:aminopeptidase N
MPVAVGLLGPDGKDMPARFDGGEPKATTILGLREKRQTFLFEGVAAAPVPSINRGFSAPIKLEVPGESQADQAFLMANDSDPFNRWEAGQRYGTRLLLDMVGAIQDGRPLAIDPAFVAAVGRILTDDTIDPAFCAQAITLPSEDFIADAMPVVDVEAIHAAHLALRRAIAAEHAEALRSTYDRLRDNAPYLPDSAPAGRRTLKNTALALLSDLGEPKITDMVVEQYGAADNMTDRMASLGILNDSPTPARKAALDAFYRRYAEDPVTIDKWFALQATSVLPDTLATVERLTRHPAFTLRNPNKVRALISSFASANPLRFHAPDGSGYDFFADRIIELEKLNPVVAARILAPLGRWRRFDEGRQARMRSALERILAVPGLSRDVYEIAAKSLG